MRTYAVYLKPKSSFITWPTSDTNFGALCWAIYHLSKNEKFLTEFLEKFNERPKFILSSAFPYLERDGIRVHFFPKPLIKELNSSDVESLAKYEIGQEVGTKSLRFKQAVIFVNQKLKEFKKVSYVSEILFREIVEKNLDLKGIYHRFRDKGSIEGEIEKIGNTLISFRERKKLDPQRELKSLLVNLMSCGTRLIGSLVLQWKDCSFTIRKFRCTQIMEASFFS